MTDLYNQFTESINPNNGMFIPTIHISNGCEGRIGKTLLMHLFCEYYHRYGKKYTLVDADPNFDVARAYQKDIVALWQQNLATKDDDPFKDIGPFKDIDFFDILRTYSEKISLEKRHPLSEQILFSDLQLCNKILDNILLETGEDILINLPPNGSINKWLDCNYVNDYYMTESPRRFNLVNWWLNIGSDYYKEKFHDFILKYPNIQHVIVFNTGIDSVIQDWNNYLRLIEKDDCRFKIVTISKWNSHPAILQEIKKGTPLHEMIGDGFQGQLIESWLQENWSSLEATGHLAK